MQVAIALFIFAAAVMVLFAVYRRLAKHGG
jgi:hypothetical protein